MPKLQVDLEFQWGHHGAALKRQSYDSSSYLHLGIFQLMEGGLMISAPEYKKRLIEPGEVFLTHAGKPSRIEQVDYDAGKRAVVQGADIRCTVMGHINLCLLLDMPLTLRGAEAENLIQATLSLHDAFTEESSPLASSIQQEATSGQILALLLECSEITPRGQALEQAQERFLPILEAMQTNIQRRMTLSQLATMAGLSKSRFRALFHETFHQSPIQFHLEMRLGEAARLLRETEHTLDQIAEATGFNTAFHLSRQFKKKLGKAPSVYRRTWNMP